MKALRQRTILELVSKERLGSQHEIRERLAAQGIEATQSTISRDIEELQLARIHDKQGVCYVAPGALNGMEVAPSNGSLQNLRRVLLDYALAMTPSGNLLLVQTPPGAAHLVGEGIDRGGIDIVAGTVAGDNTVMVVAVEGKLGRDVHRALMAIMEERVR